VSATINWPDRGDVAAAAADVERFLDELDNGTYADVEDTWEIVGRMTGIAIDLETDAWFIQSLRERLVKSYIEPIAGDLSLLLTEGAS
jgi:hypothetical protein